MMPGASARPPASSVSLAGPSLGPIAAILPSVTARSPRKAAAPVPSKISASRMTRSNIVVSSVGRVAEWAVSGEEWYTEPVIRILTIALILLSAVFDAAAQTVSFPSVATTNVTAGPQIKTWLTKPAGEGPFPAVIVLHSCAGVGPHTYAWAKLISGWGYVTLVPDSFGSRDEGAV